MTKTRLERKIRQINITDIMLVIFKIDKSLKKKKFHYTEIFILLIGHRI